MNTSIYNSRHLNLLFIAIALDIITSSLRNIQSLMFLSGFDKFVFIAFFFSLLNSRRDQIIIIKSLLITLILTSLLYFLAFIVASKYITIKALLITPFRLLLIISAYYLGQKIPLKEIYIISKKYIPIFLITSIVMYGSYFIFSPKANEILNPIAPSIAMMSSSSLLVALLSILLISYSAKRSVIIALIFTYIIAYLPRIYESLRLLKISKKLLLNVLLLTLPIVGAIFYIQNTEKYLGLVENIKNLFNLEIFESIPLFFSNATDSLSEEILLQFHMITGGRFTEIFEVHKALFENNSNLFLFGAGSGWEVSYPHPQIDGELIRTDALHFTYLDIPFRIGIILSSLLAMKLMSLLVKYGRHLSNLNYPNAEFKIYLILIFYIFLGAFNNVIIASPLIMVLIGSIEKELKRVKLNVDIYVPQA